VPAVRAPRVFGRLGHGVGDAAGVISGRVRQGAAALWGLPLRTRVIAGGAVFVGLLTGGIVALVTEGPAQITVTARFATAPGLYPGNFVDVLGMPVGSVTSIKSGPTYVSVTMRLPASVPVPAGVQALIMAPQVVNDRYVQLNPAYTGGPRLQDHAVIPLTRTATPISVDGIVDSLDQLARALGPNGANAHGALSAFVASSARAFGGDGAALHSTLTSLGRALGALSSRSPQLTQLFDNLGNLSHVASQYTATYQAFANDLAVVSTELSSDDGDIGAALTNLQQALGALAQFATTNAAALGTSVTNLDAFAGAVAAKQNQLAEVYADLPKALGNLTQALDTGASGGPALRARLDPVGDSAGFSQAVCGSSLYRLLLLSIDRSQDKDPTVDLGCGVNGVLAGLPVPPGGTSGPNLSLGALLGGTS
jgi:phospholipid/cholesterol/gamma-HCH transport system substrate-binding protein